MGASTRATGACVVTIQIEHAIEKIGDARRIGRSGGRRRSRKGGWHGSGLAPGLMGSRFERSTEARCEEFREHVRIAHAVGFALENRLDILLVDRAGAVCVTHGLHGKRELFLKLGRAHGGVFVSEANFPAAPGELQPREIRGNRRCGKSDGQNSAR